MSDWLDEIEDDCKYQHYPKISREDFDRLISEIRRLRQNEKRLRTQRNKLANCLKYSEWPRQAAREILDEIDRDAETEGGNG